MPHVITEPCVGTKNTNCLGTCPVDAIHPKTDDANFRDVDQLFIDPQQCTDCSACVDACPVGAIFRDVDVPVEWQSYIQKNRDYYG